MYRESKKNKIDYIAKGKVDDYNKKHNNKTYNYKILDNDIDLIVDKIFENMQWFEKLPLSEIQNKKGGKEIMKDNQSKSPLNQILYGPPGTGKTYHTIDKALEILGENLTGRDEKKAKFDEYVKNRQIVFTTFHQSYGYGEFVEGIKPIIDSPKVSSKEIEYEIKDGIFKEFCKRALDTKQKFNFVQIKDNFLNHCREKNQ